MSELKLKAGEVVYRLPYGEDKPEATYTLAEVARKPRALVDWNNDLFRVSELHAAGWTGKGIKVGIGDTGIQKDHPAYNGRVFWTNDYTGSPYGADDRNGHGTHCAGIVGAGRDAVTGVGAAPDCTLAMAKVLGDGGSGGSFGIAQGIRDLVDVAKVDIISLSLGSSQPDSTINAAIDYAVGKGVFVVAAAGNDGPGMGTVGWPGAYSKCLCVAAVDRNGGIAGFSSRGPEVDISGYGVQVVSSLPGSGAGRMSGTSMATPAVAGMAACVLQYLRAKGLPSDPASLRAVLEKAVKAASPATSFGKGILVPVLAVDGSAPPPPPPSPPVPPPTTPKRFRFTGSQSGFFGGPMTGEMVEVVASTTGPAFTLDTNPALDPGDVIRWMDLIFNKVIDFWKKFRNRPAELQAALAEYGVMVSLDDIERLLPQVVRYARLVIDHAEKLAPIVFDGRRAGKTWPQIALAVVFALFQSGLLTQEEMEAIIRAVGKGV